MIFSHTQGEPFFFTFGKSEVSITFLYLWSFIFVMIPYFMYVSDETLLMLCREVMHPTF